MRRAVVIRLTDRERKELESLASLRRRAQLARRAYIILLAAEGMENKDVSARVNASPDTVGKCRRRFAERRVDGLLDEPRKGAPRKIGDDQIAETVRLTLGTAPGIPPTGACARWPEPSDSRPRQSVGSGRPSIFGLVAPRLTEVVIRSPSGQQDPPAISRST